jgi:hypothetical protein
MMYVGKVGELVLPRTSCFYLKVPFLITVSFINGTNNFHHWKHGHFYNIISIFIVLPINFFFNGTPLASQRNNSNMSNSYCLF